MVGVPHNDRRLASSWLYILPVLLFLGVFFFLPIGALVQRSLFDPEFTLKHYAHILNEPVYLHVLWITFKISALVTIATMALGYPFAYAIYRANGWWRWLLLALILMPFWTSLLVRTFAFMMLLQDQGPINRLLLSLHMVGQPVPMVYNLFGVLFGMTYMLLPYFVLPLYVAMDRIDPMLEMSAMGLGASRARAMLFAFVTSFDEVIFAIFLSGGETVTLPKKIWEGLRFEIQPTVTVVATFLLLISSVVIALVAVFQRRWTNLSTRGRRLAT